MSLSSFRRLPESLRLAVTGLLGLGIGWVTYEILYLLNPLRSYRATTSWGAAWWVAVWRQHALHRWLTFPSALPRGQGLRRAYAFAAASGLLGLWVNLELTGPLGVPHRTAWLVGVLLSGLISLAFLKRAVYPENEHEE